MKVTLAKALKEKSRLAKEVSKIKQLIETNNSSLAENAPPYRVEPLLEDLNKKTEALVELKIKIQAANTGILDKIYWMSEYKSQVDFLRRIDTTEGKQESNRHFGSGELLDNKAQIDRVILDEMINKLEDNIDILQDEVDEYNHKKKIEL